MNRTETEAAISGYLPRRARRHLPAIMAAVDAHAAAGREDLDRVHAEGARRQKLVADEFAVVKAERDELATELRNLDSAEGSARAEAAELGKQVRVLVEERAAALAEGNRLRQQMADCDAALTLAEQAYGRVETERDEALAAVKAITAGRDAALAEQARVDGLYAEAAAERDRLRQELAGADAQLEIRTNMITNLEAERDRLREQLTNAPKLTIRDLSGCSCQYTVMPDGSFSRTLPRAECRADHGDGGMPAGASVIANAGCRADGEVQRSRRCVGSSGQTSNDGGPAPAPGGDAEPAPRKPRTRKPAGGNS